MVLSYYLFEMNIDRTLGTCPNSLFSGCRTYINIDYLSLNLYDLETHTKVLLPHIKKELNNVEIDHMNYTFKIYLFQVAAAYNNKKIITNLLKNANTDTQTNFLIWCIQMAIDEKSNTLFFDMFDVLNIVIEVLEKIRPKCFYGRFTFSSYKGEGEWFNISSYYLLLGICNKCYHDKYYKTFYRLVKNKDFMLKKSICTKEYNLLIDKHHILIF